MKPLEQKKHREFVVIACQEGTYQAHHWRNSHLNLINSWHVIEHSALLEMEKRAEELVKALENISMATREKARLHSDNSLDGSFAGLQNYARQALEKWRQR